MRDKSNAPPYAFKTPTCTNSSVLGSRSLRVRLHCGEAMHMAWASVNLWAEH